jgi:hypothetical protein
MMAMIRDQLVGDVGLRDFDLGMVNTLGCVVIGDDYYLPLNLVPGVTPPLFDEFSANAADIGKPMPGIPIIWTNPSDSASRYSIPCIRFRREDPSPALERWASVHYKYRRPAPGARLVTVQYGNRTLTGYDKYEDQEGGYPYDIPYTITCEAAGKGARTKAHTLLRHCMKKFPPHGVVDVVDSLGNNRKYWVYGDGPSDLSIAADIRDRTIILAISLRVQGELDLREAQTHVAVTSKPVLGFDRMENI